jgi:acetyltransferase-like isoleucine patch superfamily enzyme
MRYLKKLVRYFINVSKIDSESFVFKLRRKGFNIGHRTTFFSPESVTLDFQSPFLLSIGSDVQITKGVSFLTHGYDWSVVKKTKGEMFGSRGPIKIGNNVFIGINSIFLMNSSVGDNVIVGAGSVVTKKFDSNLVIGGNPAKIITTIDKYYENRKNRQLKEAYEIFKAYYIKYGIVPEEKNFWEYFWIFSARIPETIKKYYKQFDLLGNLEETSKVFLNSKPIFNNYSEFINYCLNEINK